ncbi:exportin-4-like [Limulus polyphemus]|uniref:Exportin-4 n=1 Tax=Limulus polyphemus TaxID=6850 RepID=A0ABM1BC05_LIMPO|nr:exportin-4-like [Limulus polyphemus]
MADQVSASLLKELEEAASVLLAPPIQVTGEQRHAAESIFLNFQKTKSPFQLCRYILENSNVDYVTFQAASLLKQAVIREWKLLEKVDTENLRNYLLQYVIQRPDLQSFVREQLLLVVAIMVKRADVDSESSQVVENVLSEVSQLISSGDQRMQTIGCSIVNALLNEYSSTTRATDVGLTWETHLIAKKKFETMDLKKIFQYCLQGLNELAKIGRPLPTEAATLFKKFLLMAEQVLTWNFQLAMLLPRKLIGLFEAQQNPTLRPNSEWKEILLDPTILELFLKLHWQVRDNPDLCHHTLQCLNQLASLNGVVMSDSSDRSRYLSWFVEGLLKLLTSDKVKEHEAVGLSNIISRLAVFFPPHVLNSLATETVKNYLQEITKLSCHFAEGAAQEEALHRDDQVYMEAFEHLLDAWVAILQDPNNLAEDVLKESAIHIFNAYLQFHLAPPGGQRGLNAKEESEEIEEIEEDDRTKFRDQLSVIGMLGRQALEHCVPLLWSLLEDRVTRLHGQLQRIHQLGTIQEDSSVLDNLNEDIHWLVLITGHVLAPFSEGETSLIPPDVVHYCVQQAGRVSLNTTLQVLASPSHRAADIPGVDQNTDHVVRLIAAVFRMCEVEKRAIEANLTHVLSPEVATTLVWYIKRWAVTYLLPNESYYTEMSMTLTGAFGKDSEAGLWTLNFLISKLETNLTRWSHEHKLAIETSQTLVSVLNNVERGSRAIQCEGLKSLINKHATNQFHLLPAAAKRGILKSLVIVGTANQDKESKEQYWKHLIEPLQNRINAVFYNGSFHQNFHREQVKSEVLDLIECVIGVADGCTLQNLSSLYPFIQPVSEEFVKLMDVYHNYSDVTDMIFQFFSVCAKRVLCFLDKKDSKKLYESCLSMIQIYAKHNTGKISHEASAEEEQYQDILVLMQLLTDLLSKDFVDFSPFNPSQEEEESSVSAADVALYGLNIIMPLMNAELLKFPNLCLQYFKLITFVCEIYPAKVCQLPETLFKNLISSVELGLSSFTPEVATLCLDFITVLGIHIRRAGPEATTVSEELKPFLKIVLDMVLFQPLDSDLSQTAGTALFTLVCCFQNEYQGLVQALIASQHNSQNAQRLINAFNELTEGVNLVLDRHNRIKFKMNFDKFTTEVRGFMLVK